ncbi:ABC transporter ATP-binding protein/permease [Rhodococcus rhodochrous]|uniref:ABC transporter ATP-binding protein/permease n=1 Tax=Rhodococcus rhodochrous TaxID=1829 RepID=A0AAW4XNE6_RHORH|nr:ABC transporter ATP-binding protein [Rhodococcus rhodochrous]MCD2114432.1 ABC transporter ATP-binding protein/permease [Rhodococcus rhodochrous]
MSIRSSLHAFRALLPALRPEYRGMLASYLTGTASALVLAALGVLTAWGIGHMVVERTVPGATWWVAVTALVLVRAVLTWQEMNVSHAVAYRVLARLRMALFDSYARSVPGRRREHSGRAAAVAMDDIEKLEFFYAHTLAQIATSLTVFIASFATAFIFLPSAAWIMLAGAVLIAVTVMLARHRIQQLGDAEQRLRADLSTQIVDALGSLREVLSYELESKVVADTLHTTEQATAVTRRQGTLTQFVTGLREALVTTTIIGVVFVGAHATGALGGATTGNLQLALLPSMVALTLAGVSAVSDAATTLTQLHPLTASAGRVHDVLRREPVVSEPPCPRATPDGPLGLRIQNLSFTYDDRAMAVCGWSAEVQPGEHVGIAGASGAGKSTIIALAARLWEPMSGTIELFNDHGDRVPLQDVDDPALRQSVALVDQETTLFHGTVRDNLLRGTGPVSDDELHRVLEHVGAAEWAALDSEIGQGGITLSGGQQARLALARALVRRPQILLVDEVTASLDPETEAVISGVLSDYPGTVLIASHRDETLQRMHRVVPIRRATEAVASPAR